MALAVIPEQDLERLITSAVQKAVSNAKPVHFPLIMNKAQLCVYLDKPTSTINRWMREGMPYRKEGNDYPEFYKPAVDEWVAGRFSLQTEVVQ